MAGSTPPPRIGYWIFNFMPEWEAASREVATLADSVRPRFDSRIFALNLKGRRLGRSGTRTYLPLPYALAALPLLGPAAGRNAINHVFASAGERLLLPRFDHRSTLLTVSKAAPTGAMERNLRTLGNLRYVVVESERDRDLFCQGGLPAERVKLIYPGVRVRAYRPVQEPFTLLFASSPLGAHDLLSRGIYLLVRVAQLLPQVRFLLVWRERNIAHLRRLVEEAGTSNVEIRNGYIPDMAAVYDSVHATVLPGLDYVSLKPCPHSALDSLAHGKPVLVSRPSSLAGVVGRSRCGLVFEPTVEALRAAILQLQADYDLHQPHCHRVVEEDFCSTVFRERYHRLYDAMS